MFPPQKNLFKTRDLELPFLRDLSQVVRRTPWDTPVPLYTRTSPLPTFVVKYTGRGLVLKRPGVLSRVQTLDLVLRVGVFSPLPIKVLRHPNPYPKNPLRLALFVPQRFFFGGGGCFLRPSPKRPFKSSSKTTSRVFFFGPRNPRTTPTKSTINIVSARLGVVHILPFS